MCRSCNSLIGGAKKGPRQNLQAEPHRQTHSSFATESGAKRTSRIGAIAADENDPKQRFATINYTQGQLWSLRRSVE